MMTIEEKMTVASDGYQLEGLWQDGTGARGVIITHPHPLYGGTMHNPVVEVIQGAYRQNGYATLRFNFRGAGGSQGTFDDGVGEQNDVAAAIAAIQEKGIEEVALAGYSFGAWVNARAITRDPIAIASMLMVSPPVGFIEFGDVSALHSLKLVVTGSRDDIAPAKQIRTLLRIWNPDAAFEIIDGCDHFYVGHLDKLQKILNHNLKTANPDLP
jgi:alpha/beta superfamily hydrolase